MLVQRGDLEKTNTEEGLPIPTVQAELYLARYEILCRNFAGLVGQMEGLNRLLNLVEGKTEILYSQVQRLEALYSKPKKKVTKKRKTK